MSKGIGGKVGGGSNKFAPLTVVRARSLNVWT